ncbi:hypothetical protein Q7P37_004472 [Cladosporium fusiforme]
MQSTLHLLLTTSRLGTTDHLWLAIPTPTLAHTLPLFVPSKASLKTRTPQPLLQSSHALSYEACSPRRYRAPDQRSLPHKPPIATCTYMYWPSRSLIVRPMTLAPMHNPFDTFHALHPGKSACKVENVELGRRAHFTRAPSAAHDPDISAMLALTAPPTATAACHIQPVTSLLRHVSPEPTCDPATTEDETLSADTSHSASPLALTLYCTSERRSLRHARQPPVLATWSC